MPKVSESYLEAHREKILDAATQCFSRKGFTETTIPDICREAQLSTGAIYRYFPNKDEIIEACIQKHREERSKHFTLFEEEGDVREMLDKLSQQQALRMLSPEPDSRARIMIHSYGEALTNPQVSKIVKDNWEEMNGRLGRLVRKAQEQGIINPDLDSNTVAALMNAIHDGLLLQKVIAPESGKVMKEVLEAMKVIFSSGKGGGVNGTPIGGTA